MVFLSAKFCDDVRVMFFFLSLSHRLLLIINFIWSGQLKNSPLTSFLRFSNFQQQTVISYRTVMLGRTFCSNSYYNNILAEVQSAWQWLDFVYIPNIKNAEMFVQISTGSLVSCWERSIPSTEHIFRHVLPYIYVWYTATLHFGGGEHQYCLKSILICNTSGQDIKVNGSSYHQEVITYC